MARQHGMPHAAAGQCTPAAAPCCSLHPFASSQRHGTPHMGSCRPHIEQLQPSRWHPCSCCPKQPQWQFTPSDAALRTASSYHPHTATAVPHHVCQLLPVGRPRCQPLQPRFERVIVGPQELERFGHARHAAGGGPAHTHGCAQDRQSGLTRRPEEEHGDVRRARPAGWGGRAAAKTEHRQRAITRGISSLQGMSERGLHQPAGSSCFVCSTSMSHLRCWLHHAARPACGWPPFRVGWQRLRLGSQASQALPGQSSSCSQQSCKH